MNVPPGPPPPPEREIFSYHYGQGVRYADPHAVQRVLHAQLGGSLAEVIRQANGGKKAPPPGSPPGTPPENDGPPVPPEVWSGAWERLYVATIAAFGLRPFDPATGQGATEPECKELLTRFFHWQADLLKKKDLRSTSPAPTVRLSSRSPTKPSTPSGSASAACGASGPPPSSGA